MAAAITSQVKKEVSGMPGMEIVYGALAASGDYYDSKFGRIYAVICTPDVAQVCGVTVSGRRVTILTAVSNVNLIVFGV